MMGEIEMDDRGKYIDYLNDQLYYWKKKEKEADNEQEKLRCQMMWGTFREKIKKEKERGKWTSM